MFVEQGVESQATIHITLFADANDLRQVFEVKTTPSLGAHIELSESKIHRIRSITDRSPQGGVTTSWRQQFCIWV